MPSSASISSSLTNLLEDPQRQLQQYAQFSHAAITALSTRARILLSSSPLLRGLISTDSFNTTASRTLVTGFLSASLLITMVSLLYWLTGGNSDKSKTKSSKSHSKNKSKSKSDGSSVASSKRKGKKKKNNRSKSKSGSTKHSDDGVELSVEEKVKNQIDAVLNDVNVNIVPEVDNYEAALINYHKHNTTATPTPISAATLAHPTPNPNATPAVNIQDNQQQQQQQHQQQQQRVDQKTKDNLNYKYLYLEETLLKQLMNLDGIDHQGIEHLRQDRKAAIKYVQGLHKKIDQLKKEFYS